MYCTRGVLLDNSGYVVGLQLGNISGLVTQQVSSLEQIKMYVDRLNSIEGVKDRALKSAYKRDMNFYKQQLNMYRDYNFGYYMQFALRPNIPVYERILRIKEGITLRPGDYYMIAFERASSSGFMQEKLKSKMIVRENEVCNVPISSDRFSTSHGEESYASYWGINSNILVVLIEKTNNGKIVHDAIFNALRHYRLGVVSKAYNKPGLQLLFLDSVTGR